jgi:hypothetical protein
VALLKRGRKKTLPSIGEAEAYERCHGSRSDDVRIVKVEPRRQRFELGFSGESLRAAFESRLDSRAPEDEAEPPPEDSEESPVASDL